MRILFLTLADIKTVNDKSIYMDLLNEFIIRGDDVTLVSPTEKKFGKKSYVMEKPGMKIIKARTGNLFNVGMIEKGISQVKLSRDYARAIKKLDYCKEYDLILYSTPPITLFNVIKKLKRQTGAVTYLLLKDIFPQNAIDIGILRNEGLKGVLYKHFRSQEKKLYALSDHIGCMSRANVEYVLTHNPELDPDKVEECPNSIAVRNLSIGNENKRAVREKYGIPYDKKVFIYGGNLGKPQDIPFIIECLKEVRELKDAHFLIVGDGTEYEKLRKYICERQSVSEKNSSESDMCQRDNVTLFKKLPKEDYDNLVAACDIGMLFLDYRFTIPNFPSRLLSYMQAGIPVLAVTDSATDVGKVAVEGGFGFSVKSYDKADFVKAVKRICALESLSSMGDKAYRYLSEHYSVESGCDIIKNAINKQ